MTKHKSDCNMAFGRKDPTCPRCQELLAGSPARSGWQKDYYSRKKRDEAMFTKALKEHNCQTANCGPVCTFGDWQSVNT